VTDFAAVDAGDARDLVSMMDATDVWPAVRAARAWVLEQVAPDERSVVVDAGCGPGTFGASVSGCAVDVDRSLVMLHEARRRQSDACVVLADVARLLLNGVRNWSQPLVLDSRRRDEHPDHEPRCDSADGEPKESNHVLSRKK
jgi:predicted TPR repeat methyltransferase